MTYICDDCEEYKTREDMYEFTQAIDWCKLCQTKTHQRLHYHNRM
jgi:hypothetical protein